MSDPLLTLETGTNSVFVLISFGTRSYPGAGRCGNYCRVH